MKKSRHPDEIAVKIGSYDLSQIFERGSVVSYPFDIIVHPDWKYWTRDFDSDIALIILEKEVQISDSIFPVCLLDSTVKEPVEMKGTVVGWGKSKSAATTHENKPREVEISFRANDVCFLKNPRTAYISSINTFCAGNDDLSGPCSGKN